jgi:choline dehydrogenase
MSRYDYVVVGGGSAGSIVAAELSADPRVSVLLLESGPDPEAHPETLSADGYKDAFANDALIWERFSSRQARCGGQRLFLGSGTGLGGSGSVNAMVYTRGDARDYDEWPAGWRWADVAADFAALEARLRPRRRAPTRFTERCIAAACEVGFARKEDLNDGDLSGVLGYEWMNFEGEARRSSYVAFLREARQRPNLTVVTGARAERLVFDADRRAVAVRYRAGGAAVEARVGREVVLSSGALETPKLLLLSGVGPGQALRAVGVPQVIEHGQVGANLHDHPNVPLFFVGGEAVDCFHPQLYGFHRANPESDLAAAQSDTCYVFYPARSSMKQAMLRLLPGKLLPQRLYRPGLRRLVRGAVKAAFAARPLARFVERVWGIVVILGKPKSRGTVSLTSANPADPARIDPAYFERDEDMRTLLAGVRLARRIAGARPLAEWGSTELFPGRRTEDDVALRRFIARNVITTYHYAGTCRMGDDEGAVLDARLRLRGLSGVRVADASAIPSTPVAAMNAPSMLVGYRAARLIREDRALPRSLDDPLSRDGTPR